jgi:hypothetical protein
LTFTYEGLGGFFVIVFFGLNSAFVGTRLGLCWIILEERLVLASTLPFVGTRLGLCWIILEERLVLA